MKYEMMLLSYRFCSCIDMPAASHGREHRAATRPTDVNDRDQDLPMTTSPRMEEEWRTLRYACAWPTSMSAPTATSAYLSEPLHPLQIETECISAHSVPASRVFVDRLL